MQLAQTLPKVTLPLQNLFVSLSWNVLSMHCCHRLIAVLCPLPSPPRNLLGHSGSGPTVLPRVQHRLEGVRSCLALLLTSLGASGKLCSPQRGHQ